MTDIDNFYSLAQSSYSSDYRCDEFKSFHDGKHILFIGDSFASGYGLDKEETWCYKLYSKISQKEKTSGYFNIGITGSSITEAIEQFFKYCHNYGNPDVVFFVTTEFNREEKYVKSENIIPYILRTYMYLEEYCNSNNISLYSFSWIKSVNEHLGIVERFGWVDNNGKKRLRPLWTEQSKVAENKQNNTLNFFKSFYDYSSKEMMTKVFEFDKKQKSKNSLWADDFCHPGISFHDFYTELMYNAYKGAGK